MRPGDVVRPAVDAYQPHIRDERGQALGGTSEGYEASAPGWPGDPDTVEDARQNPESIPDRGIDDVVEHYAALIAAMPARPILIGHSLGGMIAQKLLGQDRAAAAVAIDAAQIKGVLPVPLRRESA